MTLFLLASTDLFKMLEYGKRILFMGSAVMIKRMEKTLTKIFSTTDLEKQIYFLGAKIDFRVDSIFMSKSEHKEVVIGMKNLVDLKSTE